MKKFLDLSSWSVAVGSMLIVAFAVVGCDDDDSWSPSARPNDEPAVESSSSSETAKSLSSSDIASDAEQSSSSVATSSSSVIASETKQSSSNGSVDPISSSSLQGDKNFSSSSVASSSNSAGNVITYGTMTDSRDGQIYKTVTIGTQTWMAENLNYAYTDVPYNYGGYTSDSTSWCYDNDPANCDTYGRLYTWAAAMDSVGTWSTNGKGCGYCSTCSPTLPVRGICPEGWHLPTRVEFDTLFDAVGGRSTAGTMLKSTSGWASGGNGTDAFGFSALPAGDRLSNGYFDYDGDNAYFWSSTADYSSSYSMYLYNNSVSAYLIDDYRIFGFSVRCVKD